MYNSGVNSISIKEINRALILKLICTNKDVSRIWLANETGLTRMTLSNIINSLTEKGFLCDIRDLATEKVVGRRPVKVDLDPNAPVVAGISISRNACTGIVMDLKANMITKTIREVSKDDTRETLVAKIRKTAKDLVSSTKRQILGFGVSSIGPVDIENGIILNPVNFYDITDVHITDEIKDVTGIDAYLLNEMSAAALVEKYYGYGVEITDFAYIGVTNGIGAGCVLGGELFISKTGFSGEFGHTSIDLNGPLCGCGNKGCIEMYAAVPRIIEAVNAACGTEFTELEQINDFAKENEQADKVLKDIGVKMAVAVTNLMNIIDPSRIIFGDECCVLDEKYFKLLENEVNKRILSRRSKKVKVMKSTFGVNAPVIGSATIVADRIFTNRLKIFE